MSKTKRVTVYMPEEYYNKLRAKLILQGVYSVSKWFREVIKNFLKT